MSLDFLYLSEPDMLKAGVLDMKKCVQSMDDLFHLMGEGDYLMGSPSENHHGMMLWFPLEKRTEKMPVAGPDRRFMAMPAFVGGRFNVCGNKWYGSNIENQKKGLPRSILTVMLNDVDTGAPLALMSANLLSSTRTGAIPGVAVKYLQKKDASVLGVIGAGVISRSCLLAIRETMTALREVRVYDLFPEKAEKFAREMGEELGISIRPVSEMREAVRGCEVVSVAASGLAPVDIPDEWIDPGTLIVCGLLPQEPCGVRQLEDAQGLAGRAAGRTGAAPGRQRGPSLREAAADGGAGRAGRGPHGQLRRRAGPSGAGPSER